MELNSQLNLIEAQIRESFGRVVYTHKTQEKCADILLTKNKQIKFWQITLSALTTSSLLIVVFGDTIVGSVITATLSTISLALNAYTKDYDLAAIAEKHRSAAVEILNIRESYLSLLTDLKMGNHKLEDFQNRRDELQVQLVAVYKGSPSTNSAAYQLASKALQKNEEFTFSDAELNKFLPKELRKEK